VVDYYARIHPDTRFDYTLTEEAEPSEYRVFYTVMTATEVREAVAFEERIAAERGCKLERENLYRAAVLTVRCRARNSDP
jgi:hypothetical protein